MNAAVGGRFVGGVDTVVRALRLLTFAVTGKTVLAPDRYVLSPIDPFPCTALVLSVAVCCQAVGSVAPDHTFHRTVVGLVPVTCNRVLNTDPAATVTPLATTSDFKRHRVLDPGSTPPRSPPTPSPRTRARPSYSAFVATRRPTTVTYNPLLVGNGFTATPSRRSVSLLDTAGNATDRVSPAFWVTNDAAPADTE